MTANDVVIYTDGDAGAYRCPRTIARLLNANGFATRTVVVIDRHSGLISQCLWDDRTDG